MDDSFEGGNPLQVDNTLLKSEMLERRNKNIY